MDNLGSFTFCIIKPHIVRAGGSWLVKQRIIDNGFEIVKSRLKLLQGNQIVKLYPHIVSLPDINFLESETYLSNIASESELIVLWHSSKDAPRRLREQIVGEGNSDTYSLRKEFGLTKFQNAVHGSDTLWDVVNEIRICYPEFFNEVLDSNCAYSSRFSEFLESMPKKVEDEGIYVRKEREI